MDIYLDYLTPGTVIDLEDGVSGTVSDQRTSVTRLLTTSDGDDIWMPASTAVTVTTFPPSEDDEQL